MRTFAAISATLVLLLAAYYTIALALSYVPALRIGMLFPVIAFPVSIIGINDVIKSRRGRIATMALGALHTMALVTSGFLLCFLFGILAILFNW
jgi:hypothetical protein